MIGTNPSGTRTRNLCVRTSFCRWAIYVNAPSGLVKTVYGPDTNLPSYLPLLWIGLYEARVDPDTLRHRDGANDFRVYASGLSHPCHPARYVPQYPMGD